MIYLYGQLVYPFPWLPLALAIGVFVGWHSCGPAKEE